MTTDSTFFFHTLRIRPISDSLPLSRIFSTWYIENQLQPEQASSQSKSTSTLELRIESRPKHVPVAPSPLVSEDFARMSLCQSHCFFRDGAFVTRNPAPFEYDLEFVPRNGVLRGTLGGLFLSDEQTVFSHFLRPLLQSFLLWFYGLKTIHGALVRTNGSVLLLLGPSGAGKSTLACAMAEAGYDVLSDDGPLLISWHGATRILPSLDPMHLSESTLEMFPAIAALRTGMQDPYGKFFVPKPRALCQVERPLRVTDIVWIRPAHGGRSSLCTLPTIEASRRLIEENMIVFPAAAPGFGSDLKQYSASLLELLGGLVSGARSHELSYVRSDFQLVPELVSHLAK